ncbi:hydrogenase-2 small chain [Escherichia coli]|uniref:hydrogenase (acceptor) n=1 Tax=Escherichia coli TaxID=562 RepID=A0A376UIG1_ECOLX|nr:hydrogenase-2 small chain [Escherichia coli]
MTGDNTLIHSHGINRRDFMKLCAALAATMGLSSKAAAEMAESVTNPQHPPVIWIGAQECTGCTESLLRATHPTVENLVLETISLEYHEVLSAAFGHQVEENKHNALEKYKGQYVLVVDGSIPLKDNGIYCMVAGEPIVDHIRKAAGRRSSDYRYRFPALRGAVLPQLELTQLAQSVCKKFCQAKPLSIFRAARRTRTTSSRPLRTSSLTANRRNWMTKIVRPSPMAV